MIVSQWHMSGSAFNILNIDNNTYHIDEAVIWGSRISVIDGCQITRLLIFLTLDLYRRLQTAEVADASRYVPAFRRSKRIVEKIPVSGG